jgi:hypothetical protein
MGERQMLPQQTNRMRIGVMFPAGDPCAADTGDEDAADAHMMVAG